MQINFSSFIVKKKSLKAINCILRLFHPICVFRGIFKNLKINWFSTLTTYIVSFPASSKTVSMEEM